MSKKLTEEELDAKFEEFMQKLSTDEETSQSLSLAKEKKKEEKKDTLWWLKDDKADDNKPDASKPNLINWLKSTSKTISSEKTSRSDNAQSDTSVANVPPDKRKPEDDQSEISERDNSTLPTESSLTKTNSRIIDSKTSQILSGGGDYSEDFESGKLDTRTSDQRTETHGDVNSANEQLSTLDELTLKSGSSESLSAIEQPSQHDNDGEETSSGHQSAQEEDLKPLQKDVVKHQILQDDSSSSIIKQAGEETNKNHFGQETFVIKSNSRGVEEILKEAEEIERSNSRSMSSESRLGRLKEAEQTITIQKLPTEEKYHEPRKSILPATNSENVHLANVDNLNLQQLLKEERKRYAKLKVEVSAQENDSKKRLENQRILYEEKLLHLEAENVHLTAKIDELRQKNAKDAKKSDVDDDGLIMGKTDKLRKEFKEQEHLIVGYQRENEHLCDQLKNFKNELKRVRAEHSVEKQRLLSDLTNVKRNSQRNDVAVREKTFSLSIRDEMQHKIDELLQEIQFLKVENTNLTQRQSVQKKTNSDENQNMSEVTGLKSKIVALENEIRKKNLEQSSTETVLAAKETRIHSLENQVKQLEQLVSVRHPNSISALVLAAGAMEDDTRQHRTVQFLENRVRELDEKLSSQHDDENSALRGIHEQYMKLKEHYEARIAHLEELKGVAKSTTTRPKSCVTSLEKELDSIRERHRKEAEKMKDEIATLRRTVKQKSASQQSDDHGLVLKVRVMSNELASKDKQIKILQQKLEEVKSSAPALPPKSNLGLSRKSTTAINDREDESDVKEENRMLKAKVQQLIGQVESLRGTLQVSRQKSMDIQDNNGQIKKLEDDIAAKRSELREAHARLRRANDELSEIRCRNEILELVTTQLKDQLAIVRVDSEQIKRLRAENAELRLQCHEFRERLVMAEVAHSPEWKHYAMLQARVNEVEKKYRDKSNELVEMAERYRKSLVKDDEPNESLLRAEVSKWKALVEKRNGEIAVFRDQMSEIIAALESLQAEVRGKRKTQ